MVICESSHRKLIQGPRQLQHERPQAPPGPCPGSEKPCWPPQHFPNSCLEALTAPIPWPVTIYMCTLQSSGFSLDGASSQLAWSTSGQCCQGLSPVWSISPMVWQWEALHIHPKWQTLLASSGFGGIFSVFPNSQPQLLCHLEYEINTTEPWYAKCGRATWTILGFEKPYVAKLMVFFYLPLFLSHEHSSQTCGLG